MKRVTRPMLGFKSFDAAQDTLVGIELMHMIKKRQLVVEEGKRASLRPNSSTPWLPNPAAQPPSRYLAENLRHNLSRHRMGYVRNTCSCRAQHERSSLPIPKSTDTPIRTDS